MASAWMAFFHPSVLNPISEWKKTILYYMVWDCQQKYMSKNLLSRMQTLCHSIHKASATNRNRSEPYVCVGGHFHCFETSSSFHFIIWFVFVLFDVFEFFVIRISLNERNSVRMQYAICTACCICAYAFSDNIRTIYHPDLFISTIFSICEFFCPDLYLSLFVVLVQCFF